MGKAAAAGEYVNGWNMLFHERPDPERATGVMTTACLDKEINATRETPSGEGA